MQCEDCRYWDVNPNADHVGHCSIELPPWAVPDETERVTRYDHSCDLGEE